MKKKILGLAAPVALVAALCCSGAAFADEAVVTDTVANHAGTIEVASVVESQTLDGWKQVDGKWYHFTDGSADINQYIDSPNGAGRRYLGADGAAVTGWYKVSDSSGYYWIWADQSYNVVLDGWKTINGKKYFFKEGKMVAEASVPSADGMAYSYVGSNGAMITGWYKTSEGNWVWADSAGIQKKNGWKQINSKWYYFDNDGMMLVNAFAFSTDGTKECYLGPNGAMAKGWVKIPDEGSYFWAWGKNDGTLLEEGWVKDNGKWYYISGYEMLRNDFIPNSDGTKFYYVGSNGAMITGWYKTSEGNWVWADAKGVIKDEGWKQINNKWYFFSGRYMLKNCVISNIKGTGVYALGSTGAMISNAWVKDDHGVWFYLGSKGLSLTGWQKIKNKWYYLQPDYSGAMAADCTLTIGHDTYKFDENGKYTKI